MELNYHHIGIPTGEVREDEGYLEGSGVHFSGYDRSAYGVEWLRFDEDSPLPEVVKTVPHVAFQVDDVREAVQGKKVIVEPNSPTEGILVAFIEENGAPIEFIQITSSEEQVFTRRE
ncbi:MAG: hypothetical protein KKF41_16545 [Actinobacteria bacterium]|nr:hypothetical protein [Actinomycetota bacterium]MBU1944637.1 hypothetical protein [Actinomycetota bacterium]MBU2689189.1 hypothetical protein [Actinomycetota bacterium]